MGPPEGVRPTSDRVREALFARLGDLAGARVLDLFAGTGALGIEALSRGADHVVCVDRSRKSVEVIEKNLERLELGSQAQTLCTPARGAIRRLGEQGDGFDLVFLDPPYDDIGVATEILPLLLESNLLNQEATVVVEGPKQDPLVLPIPGFEVEETRRYGDTIITWFYAEKQPLAGGREPKHEQ